MKSKFLIVKIIIFIFTLFIFFNVNAKSVSLNELYEIRNNANELETITQVNIGTDDNLDYTNILSELPNLSYLYITIRSFDDFTFINNINHEFSISVSGGLDKYINLSGINNQYLKSISFSVISINNFSSIQNLSNLTRLSMDCIFNYDEIDYNVLSKLINLEELSFQYIGINDFQNFFYNINQLNKLNRLTLEGVNIQNKDTKYLKENQSIKNLSLNETMINDISFLKEMTNITSISLPTHITDFSVLYEMENLKSIWWDNYTQYNVTSELVNYLDSKGISHTKYYSDIRDTIDGLVTEANILDTDSDYTKVIKIMKVIQSFATIDTHGYNPSEDTGGTTLSKIVLLKKGVCANWSALSDAMLNIVGVESYKVGGFMGAAHNWNIVKLDGKYYAIDIMNARPYPSDYFDISTWNNQTKERMFRDLFRVDSYRRIDAENNNLDYNYNYPLNYIETDGYDATEMLYEFENVEGVTNISKKNIWVDLNTNITSLNLVPISGYSYKYYAKDGNIKNTGIAETGDYIIVTSSNNANYSHKYEIIVEEKTYEIKLESDSFGKNESITVKNGGKYTGLFTPIKFCYKFLGWYTAKTGGTQITEDSIVDISKVNTLYAHWQFDNKYILTVHTSDMYVSLTYIFEPNDIYYNVKNTSDDSSNPQLNNANYARPPGKKFSGFYTEKDGGNLLTYYSTVVTDSNHSIYAHFVDENDELYTISLKCTGCNINTAYTWPVEPNTKISKFYNPTRDGYTFKYWSINGEQFDFDTPVTSNITLTAEWEIDKYTVTFNSNGGSNVTSQTVNYNSTATKPNNPTRDGYTFKKWLLNGSEYNFGTAVTSNITLTAEWEVNKYTVTFNSNGGSSVASQTINYNGKATKPNNPTRDGYTFKKWLLNGSEYNFGTAVTSNITLTAEWEIDKYTVAFNSNGGSSVTSQTINYNSTATKPNNPTREGYTFKKWLLNGSEYNFGTAVTSNITLTAEWEKQEIVDNDTLKDILEKDGHIVNNSYTSKFTLGDSIASIKNKLGDDVIIETDKNIIATGAVIKKGNESYAVVIKGDLNGDGKVNSADLLQMRKYLLEEVNLTGAYKEAGIIESNGEIKSLDLLRLRQYLLDEYVFK